MSLLKDRCLVTTLVALTACALLSCQNLKRADQADGLLDFVLIATARGQPNVAPIERATTGGAEVVTVRALASGSHALVRGSLEKQARPGWVSAAFSHVDVIVLNSNRRITETEVVSFFPSEIPATLRGVRGRSHFSTTIRQPPAGSLIRVVFHNVPRKQCQFYGDAI